MASYVSQKCNNHSLRVWAVALNSAADADGCVGVPDLISHMIVGTALDNFHSTTSQPERSTGKSDYNVSLGRLLVL